MHVNRINIIILFFTFIFSNELEFEKINFKSADPFSFSDIILNLEDQIERDVKGVLRFPNDENRDKYPLVIGVAGSLGWGEHHHEFLRMYREMGIATFELQSFKSRNVESTVGSQVEVTMPMMILDSYRALDKLANHPQIDKDKIAITGWSLGGGVSLFSAWEPVYNAINSENKFVAHLPFYPPCFIKPEDLAFIDSPIHILIGEIDDWTPADACVNLVDNLKNKANIDITVYENSHHSFDSTKPIQIIEHGYSFSDCMFKLNSNGEVLMNYINIPMSSPFLQKIGLSFCVDRGPSIGGNKEARQKAFNFSEFFMRKYLLE
tara:strand:- start:20 stop:982 length:963 start_codon:yes stop_codon:yes gene_type:complete